MTAAAGIFSTKRPFDRAESAVPLCSRRYTTLKSYRQSDAGIARSAVCLFGYGTVNQLVVLSMGATRGASRGSRWGEKTMGTVIAFPVARRAERVSARYVAAEGPMATIIILPVIRIERMDDAPADNFKRPPAGRKRRRRSR